MLDHSAIAGAARPGTYSQTLFAGNFAIVISLTGPQDEVTLELGRNTINKIEEIISQSPEIRPSELAEIVSEQFQNAIKPNIAIAKIESPFGLAQGGQKLLLAALGAVNAKLIRKEKIINLLPATSYQLPATRSISGPLHHNDLLILGTDQFFSHFSLPDLASHFSLPTSEIRDMLLLKVEALENDSPVAAVFLRLDLTQGAPEEEITNHQPPITRLLSRANLPNLKTLYPAILILITLIALVAFQLRSRDLENKTKSLLDIERKAKESMDAAQKLTGLDDISAKETLVSAKNTLISQGEAVLGPDWQKKNSSEAKKLLSLLTSLNSQISLTSHIYEIKNLDLFYDFSLLRAQARIKSASLHKNETIALDQDNGAVYSLSTKSKTAAIITGSENFKKGQFLDFAGNSVFVWNPSGIDHIDRSSQTASSKPVIKQSDQWGEIRGFGTFAGNLYLLDSPNNQIWKYQGTDFGFATISAYLKAGSVDFSKVAAMSIDGYIYVLSTSGNLVRFAAGYADGFKLTGLDGSLNSPSFIFATDETENIYILDANGSRVTVFDKKGAYRAQYLLPAASNQQPATSLLADESLKNVFLISGPKVFSFGLK